MKRSMDYCESTGVVTSPPSTSAPSATATIDPSAPVGSDVAIAPAAPPPAGSAASSPSSPASSSPSSSPNASSVAVVPPASAASQCRDDTFCTWDCFSSSLFVSQCESSTSGSASYAKSGQLCATVDEVKAVCEGDDCMSLNAQKGFYKLSVDINCTRDGVNEPCNISPSGGADWIRPASAARAMGTNTEGKVPRCPKERWLPLLENDPAYTKQVEAEYGEFKDSLQLSTECFDIVSCFPKAACNGSNICNENGYQYTYRTCRHIMEKNGTASERKECAGRACRHFTHIVHTHTHTHTHTHSHIASAHVLPLFTLHMLTFTSHIRCTLNLRSN